MLRLHHRWGSLMQGLAAFLFQQAIESLEPGHPQIVGPLRRCSCRRPRSCLTFASECWEMVANTGDTWAELYGAPFADDVVMSIADSNLLCAASAARAIQFWEPGGAVSTPLLLWAKRHFPGIWEANAVEAFQLPQVPKMIQELPSYEDKIKERRDLANTTSSLENNIRLWGKLKGTMMSMFRHE